MTVVETKPKAETYTFTSARSELLLFLTPHRKVAHPDGTSETVYGKTVQFEHGQFVADDRSAVKVGYDSVSELADALRGSPHFDQDFFEIKVEPVAPAPTDALIGIARLVAEGDVDALVELEELERAEWGREPVLQAINGALDALKRRALEATEE